MRSFAIPVLLFCLTFALASLFAWRTPRWQAPDEPAHYAYVQHVAQTGRPPILVAACYDEEYKNKLVGSNFAETVDFDRFCYEGHQPPFFYYLAAPIYLLSDGSLFALRLFCAFLGAWVPVVAWAIARGAGASIGLSLATATFVALEPQHLAMIGSLNNDALTFLLVALAVWQMIALLRGLEASPRDENHLLGVTIRLAILSALALLTKTLAWVVLPLLALTFWLVRTKLPLREWLLQGFLVGSLITSAAFLWFGRNLIVYGGMDILGLARHDAITIGQPRTAAEIATRGLWGTIINGTQTTFHSFWGQFGWMKAPLHPQDYLILGLFSLLALIGLLFWLTQQRWHKWAIDSRILLLFAVWSLTIMSLFLYYNLEYVQYQGRYLFSALTPIAFFFMLGLGAWLPSRLRPLPWCFLLLFLLYLDLLAILERLPGMINY